MNVKIIKHSSNPRELVRKPSLQQVQDRNVMARNRQDGGRPESFLPVASSLGEQIGRTPRPQSRHTSVASDGHFDTTTPEEPHYEISIAEADFLFIPHQQRTHIHLQ